jgi:outer membrane murein-binding lipoprotein Lpp
MSSTSTAQYPIGMRTEFRPTSRIRSKSSRVKKDLQVSAMLQRLLVRGCSESQVVRSMARRCQRLGATHDQCDSKRELHRSFPRSAHKFHSSAALELRNKEGVILQLSSPCVIRAAGPCPPLLDQ